MKDAIRQSAIKMTLLVDKKFFYWKIIVILERKIIKDYSINIKNLTKNHIMSIRRFLSSFALISLAFMTFHVVAGNINATTARAAANNYLKQLAATKPGTFSPPPPASSYRETG